MLATLAAVSILIARFACRFRPGSRLIPESARLAGGMQRDALVFLLCFCPAHCGYGGPLPIASHALAEQAAPGNLSGAEDRAAAADDALRIYRRDLMGRLGGFAGLGFDAAVILALRWVITDQQRRCPVCLRLLTDPVRIGTPSRTFLEWYGAESTCPRGHGLLHVSEMSSGYSARPEWLGLDDSWSGLFTGR